MTNVPQKIQDRIDELASMIHDIDAECAASRKRMADVEALINDRQETRASIQQEMGVLNFAVGEYEKAGSQVPLPLSSASPDWQSATPVFDALVARKQTPSGESTLPVLIAGLLATRPMTAKELFDGINVLRPATKGGIAGTMSGMSRRGEIVKHPDGWALAR